MSSDSIHPAVTEEIVSFNPATGEEIGRVRAASEAEAVKAVVRGREAFRKWRETGFAERRRLLFNSRKVILDRIDEIAHLISAESGKPFAEAISMEIAPALDLMRYFARNAEKMLRPRRVSIGLYALLGRSSKIIYQPFGVVVIIPAWNFPFSIPIGEAAMALMAGNTVIIKPSELTPITGLKIGEVFRLAGFPENVVQILSGDGRVGAALVEAAPDKIMFTGSVATGRKISAAAAKNLTPVVLELGGKDPMIVFDDANLELASSAAVWGAFCNSGQSCSSVERLYVQAGAADKLTRLIIEKTRRLKQGTGDREDISIGAMSSEKQVQVVEGHVEKFRSAGAKIETGGKRALIENAHPDGQNLFFEPTVITGAKNEMPPMQEETFGPTLPIAIFETEAEAIALANESEFGLTASVWTSDYARGRRVARRIEAGSVCVNEVLYTHGIGQTPWGGFKNSGRGRTHGAEGLMELVQPQHIHINRFALLPDAWWLPYSPEAVKTFRGFATKFATGSLLKTAALLPQLWKRIMELKKQSRDDRSDNNSIDN